MLEPSSVVLKLLHQSVNTLASSAVLVNFHLFWLFGGRNQSLHRALPVSCSCLILTLLSPTPQIGFHCVALAVLELCRQDWPQTHRDPPTSASQMLGLKDLHHHCPASFWLFTYS